MAKLFLRNSKHARNKKVTALSTTSQQADFSHSYFLSRGGIVRRRDSSDWLFFARRFEGVPFVQTTCNPQLTRQPFTDVEVFVCRCSGVDLDKLCIPCRNVFPTAVSCQCRGSLCLDVIPDDKPCLRLTLTLTLKLVDDVVTRERTHPCSCSRRPRHP